jgi:D-arabinono-1,4-lactone oxidase
MTIAIAGDGFYHPASEAEIVELIAYARDNGLKLRVRGAAHSVAHAIYTDPHDRLDNSVCDQAPPAGDNLNLMLDRYRSWEIADEQRRRIVCDAGLHLGADPGDPTGTATEPQDGLLWQLWDRKRWMLSATGGISHQTVSGFTATGSSGGSLTYSASDDLVGFRLIDGTGTIHDISRDDDPERFGALCPNLGLLGVVSKVTLQCEDTFDIAGRETIAPRESCAIDVFGDGDGQRPSLAQFLTQREYARVEWWPQRGAERFVVWEARRTAAGDGETHPYQEFTDHPELAEFAISLVFTLLGNLPHLDRAKPRLHELFAGAKEEWCDDARASMGEFGALLADVLEAIARAATTLGFAAASLFAETLWRDLDRYFPKLIDTFQADSDGHPQEFSDRAWHGLPMDNEASDTTLPTSFTELWFPLGRTKDVVNLLEDWFAGAADDRASYDRTGINAWELYAAKPNHFWLSPSYTTGDDEWRDGAFRVDVYWFVANDHSPARDFFPRVWQLARDAGIPFRLHWGKYQPPMAEDPAWRDVLRAQYPRWDDFLALRAQMDPGGTFLSSYWRAHFGL